MPQPIPWTTGRMPLRQLVQLARNPKDHDIGAIIGSIRRFGYVELIVVNVRTGHLVHGHGRDMALSQMRDSGMDAPIGVNVTSDDWEPSVYYVDIPETEEIPLTIALNRTSELGGWDEAKLVDVLTELAEQGSQALEGIGFDADDLDAMLVHTRIQEYAPDDVFEADTSGYEGGDSSAYIVYVSFPDAEMFKRGLAVLTYGQRSLMDDEQRYAAIDGSAFLDDWEEALGST